MISISSRVRGMDAAGLILVALGEVVGLDVCEVLERGRVLVDDHVVDDLEGGQVHRPKLLRDERAVVGLRDVGVAGQAGDQDIGLALGIHQVPQVTRVDQVECAVAHDHLAVPRPGADRRDELVAVLDLAAVVVGARGLGRGGRVVQSGFSSESIANHVFVAAAIDSGSQSGADRQ